MSKSKKPRKAYRPRPVHLNSIQRAIENASKLDPADVAKAVAGVDEAFDRFRQAVDPVQAWRVMADALNMAETMSDLGICSDADSLQLILDGQAVLARAADQRAAIGTWALRAADMTTLREALDRHHLQLQFVSLSEYERAIELTRARVDAARRGQGKRPVLAIGDLGRLQPA
jgi:hypothetical protein